MRSKMRSVGKGYTARMAAMRDLPRVTTLVNTASQHFLGVNETTLERQSNDWQTPGFEPQHNAHVVISSAGKMVGVVEVWDITTPPVHPFSWMAVDPHLEDADHVRKCLLQWAEERSRQVLTQVEPDLRVSIRFWTYHDNLSTAKLLEERGFELARHSFRMRYEMDGPPPSPVFPDGISVRRYDPDRDAEQVYRVDDEVFQDHFGYIEEPFEEGFPRFMHHMTGHEAYDPDLWFLAQEGDEVVGICLCRKWDVEDRDVGYISSLGVRRPWRRQGIAQALLYHAFGEFHRRGKEKVDLGVDAENLTGAMDLYNKAGMVVHRQYDMYEKELRPGKEISVTGLNTT